MSGKVQKIIYYVGFGVFIFSQLMLRAFPAAIAALGIPLQSLDAFSGFGAGIILVGGVYMFIQKVREQDPVWQKEHEIQTNDERNILLREKASYLVCHITFLTLWAFVMVFLWLGNLPALGLCLVIMVIQKGSLFIAERMYAKKF